MKLNPQQKLAVQSIHGPLLIFAGAGSGKTRVIVHRIRNMIENSIVASSIVAVTFTNKSAKEMKERLKHLLPKNKIRGITVSTFHALGNKILQSDIEVLGYRKPYVILDENDRIQIMRNIYKDMKLNPDDVKKDNILFLISLFKNSCSSIDEWLYQNSFLFRNFSQEIFQEIYLRYSSYLFSLNSVDFDDLILYPIQIFQSHPEILKKYHRRYQYFLVDEFQDTNPMQYKLLKFLSSHTKNVCVVGDDDQSIYGWRGADVSIIQNFQKDFPDAKIIILNRNYRSTQNILNVAHAVIQNNQRRINKQIISMDSEGEKIQIMECYDEKEEAKKVAEIIQKKIVRENKYPSDIAILYRTNYQSRVFESELRKRNIPHYVVGGYRFFDRKEVKDILAYLRVIANPLDEISLLRIINFPKRGIGQNTIEKIYKFIEDMENQSREKISFMDALYQILKKPKCLPIQSNQYRAILSFVEFIEKYRREFTVNRSLSNALYKMIQELKLEEEFLKEGDSESVAKARLLNMSELINMLSFFEEEWEETHPPSLFDFLARISLLSSGEDKNPKGKVQLLTLHLSKGLEFDIVFLCGMNEKIFPAERSLLESGDNIASLEEERRLCYVGITRAKKELYMTYTLFRRRFGEEIAQEPSRFLKEIPEQYVQREFCDLQGDKFHKDKDIRHFIDSIKGILAG